MHALKKPS